MPGLGEANRLVELRQREDAAGDQKVAQRAIGRARSAAWRWPIRSPRQRGGGDTFAAARTGTRWSQAPQPADDPGAEALGDREPRALIGIGNPQAACRVRSRSRARRRSCRGRRRRRDRDRRAGVTGSDPSRVERLDPQAGQLVRGHDLRDRAGGKPAEIEHACGRRDRPRQPGRGRSARAAWRRRAARC